VGFGLSFLPESLGFLGQPIRESQRVLETTSRHGTAPCWWGGSTKLSVTDMSIGAEKDCWLPARALAKRVHRLALVRLVRFYRRSALAARRFRFNHGSRGIAFECRVMPEKP
jgi:hypothetical protein